MRRNKKSQMEMFGIAFVVILVALGMLFAVRFALNKPEAQTKEQFTQKQLAQNFVTTLLATSTGCKRTDLAELLEDCGNFETIECEGMGSCEFAEVMTAKIINDTLDSWNRAYRFKATTVQGTLLEFNSTQPCLDSRPGFGYIPLGARGMLVVKLDIC